MKRKDIIKTMLTSMIIVATMTTTSMAKELPVTRKGYSNAERLSKITKHSHTTLQTADIVPMEYEVLGGYIAESGPKLGNFKPDFIEYKFDMEGNYVYNLVTKTGHYNKKEGVIYANIPVYKVRDRINKEVFYMAPLVQWISGTESGKITGYPVLPKMPKEYKGELGLDNVYFSDYSQALIIREDVINDSWYTKQRKRVIDYFNENDMKPLKRLKMIDANSKKVMPENVSFEDIHKVPYEVLVKYASVKINRNTQLWIGGDPFMILRKPYNNVPKGGTEREFFDGSTFGMPDDYMYEELVDYDVFQYGFAPGLSEKDKKDGYEFYKKLFNMPKNDRDAILEELAAMLMICKTGI